MKDQTLEKLLDAQELADAWGCCKRTILSRAKAGEIPSLTLPGSRLIRFRPSAVEAFIAKTEKLVGR